MILISTHGKYILKEFKKVKMMPALVVIKPTHFDAWA